MCVCDCEGVSLCVKTMLDVYHSQSLAYLCNESANTPPKLCKYTKSVSCNQRVVLYIAHKTLEHKTFANVQTSTSTLYSQT